MTRFFDFLVLGWLIAISLYLLHPAFKAMVDLLL